MDQKLKALKRARHALPRQKPTRRRLGVRKGVIDRRPEYKFPSREDLDRKGGRERSELLVAHALKVIAEDGKAVGTSQLDWEKIEATARDYVGQKTINGRYQKLEDLMGPKPTYDMLQGREIVP